MYKRYELLHDYLLTADGNVIELDTLEQVPLANDPARKSLVNYKLLTDEKVWLDTKQKHIRLWRRFTVDDVVKMYNSPKATLCDIEVDSYALLSGQVECTGVTSPPISAQVETAQVCTGDESAQVVAGKSAQVRINEVVYKSISDAATQLSINRRTIKKRLDDEANKAYVYVD